MICIKYCWNWSSDSGEDENVKDLQPDGRRTTGNQKSPQAFNACELYTTIQSHQSDAVRVKVYERI